MGRRLRQGHADQVLLLYALLLVAAVRLGLWLIPFRLFRRIARRLSRPFGKLISGDPAHIVRVSKAVALASRCVPCASCLTQAMAARILLAWHGLDADLHIGVAKKPGEKFAAHAWLTSQGYVVTGNSELGQFQPLLVMKRDRA